MMGERHPLSAWVMAMGWCPRQDSGPKTGVWGILMGWTTFAPRQALLAAAPRLFAVAAAQLCTVHGQLLKQLAARATPEALPSGWTTATAA